MIFNSLSKYSKYLKPLSLIPLLVGILTLLEPLLPLKETTSFVVEKETSYRLKTNSTTYTIHFMEMADQFTEEIYNSLKEGDDVMLLSTYFNKEIREIINIKTKETFENETYDNYALLIFGIIFLIGGLALFKKQTLSNMQSKYLFFIIIIAIVTGLRIIF